MRIPLRFSVVVALACLPAAQATRSSGAPAGSASVELPQPGNVLVLLADDMGVDQLSLYGQGSDYPPTPNLDQLAANGVVFRNAWSEPTCSPTRAALMTGRHGFRHSIGAAIDPFVDASGLAASEVTLPEMLDLGTGGRYAHALIGKWHLTPLSAGDLAPNQAGFAHFAGSLEGQIINYVNWRRVVNGVPAMSSRYATSAAVDDALSWIGQQNGPWLCFVAFQAPHAPFHAPPPSLHTQSLPSGPSKAFCGDTFGNEPRPYYKAMIQALDTEIGRLLASLPARELARTTVLFLADNGSDPCVSAPPTNRAKGTLYQRGVNVPLIAAGYRVGRGVSSALVTTSDLFATVAELAGVDLQATLPGLALDSLSFVPSLAEPSIALRRFAFAEYFTPNGPGNPRDLPACPSSSVCQQDLGFDGPGSVVLASCGTPLYGTNGANVVPWQVSGGPPFATGTLRIGSFSPAFDGALGATLVSNPPAYTQAFTLGAGGSYSANLWTGGTSRELHYQVVVSDPTQAGGFTVSNALRIAPLWTDMQAARDGRYKLIRSDPCDEEFYDLALDPLETTELLARGLTATERAAYERLAVGLDSIP
jgi:arylsulfatase A-like enzyme